MPEFRSKLENIMSAHELLFDSTPGFGDYKPFLEHSIAHPAKMNMKLLEFLIKNFTKEGETVLDPMCGSGSTGVVVALHGRNAVQIDIEEKFIKWSEEAKKKVMASPSLTPKGSIFNVCGDARKLSELLKGADVILTSPPYSDIAKSKEGAISPHMQGLISKLSGIPVKEFAHDVTKLKEAVKIAQSQIPFQYSESKDNIGNLPHGNVDAVITSPPYTNRQPSVHTPHLMTEKKDMDKISKVPHGFGHEEKNIGNLPFDAVITSPPYADTNDKKNRKMDSTRGIKNRALDLPQNPENIGNLKSETYLEAMLKVYMEMHEVLKPNGLAIIVIKPFIRNKKVVDLPYHTWLLLEKVGFKLVKLFKLRLQQESFWRILYSKKYPSVKKIRHEYVLVTQKIDVIR